MKANWKANLRLYAPVIVVVVGGVIKFGVIEASTPIGVGLDAIILLLLGASLWLHIRETTRRRAQAIHELQASHDRKREKSIQ